MKRFFAIAGTAGLLFSGTSAGAEPWTFDPGPIWETGQNVFEIEEVYSFGEASKIGYSTVTGRYSTNMETCEALGVAPCLDSLLGSYRDSAITSAVGQSQLEFFITMPACDSANAQFCIDDVLLYQSGRAPVEAELLRSTNGNTTPALPKFGIPAGGTVSLWKGAADSGLDGLSVAAFARAEIRPKLDPLSKKVSYEIMDFSFEIQPYVLDPNRAVKPAFIPLPDKPGLGSLPTPPPGCIWVDDTGCGVRIDFPENIRVGATLRSNLDLSAFFNGRLKDPMITSVKSNGVLELTVDAEPVVVPQLAVAYDESSGIRQKLGVDRPGWNSTKAFYDNAFKAVDILREFTGDRASGENTIWRMSSMGDHRSCYKDVDIAGFVVTNATTYGGSPPRYQDGFLDYRVAGMHYLSNGKDLFEGTYDLVIKSDVARCLYGYSKAPISATVTVVGAGGESKVATSQVSESDGWLKLSAYGFTFSENRIKVKISQPQVKTLSKFTGSSAALNSKQKAEIKQLADRTKGNSSLTCSGYFTNAAGKAAALKRAQAACAYAKSLNKSVTTKALAVSSKRASDAGRVQLNSK